MDITAKDIPSSPRTLLTTSLETLGVRRAPIPQPGFCVGSSLELSPKYRENAHHHTTPCIEQLPTSLLGAVNEGKH